MNSGTPLRHQLSRDYFPDDTELDFPPDDGYNPAYDLRTRGLPSDVRRSNYGNDYSLPARSSTLPPSFANRNEFDRDPSDRQPPPRDPARPSRSGRNYNSYGSSQPVRRREPDRSFQPSQSSRYDGQNRYPQDTGHYPQSTPRDSSRGQTSDSYAPGPTTQRSGNYPNGNNAPTQQTRRHRGSRRESAPEEDPMVCKVCHVEECTIPDICQLAKHEGSREEKRQAADLWDRHRREVEASSGQYEDSRR